MSTQSAIHPSDETVAEFQRDGVVVLRGLFSDWVEPLRAGIEKNMASPSAKARRYHPEGSPTEFFQDFCVWDRIPEYREFIFDSPTAPVAARLMRSKTARLFHEHVLVKEPGTTVATPWHHDQPYYCVDGVQNCSFWLALDDVPRETVVQYIAGSHRWGRWFRPERFDGSPLNDNAAFEPIPDFDAALDDYDIRGWAMQAGDALAFHFLTLHAAAANPLQSRRRAFSTRWLGDDAVFADRGGTISPPFPDLEINHGAPFEGPEFPVVYREGG